MVEELGNFTQAEIESLAHEVRLPEGAGETPTQRFVKQVSNLVALRIQAGETVGISVFLRSDALDSDIEGSHLISRG